MWPQSRNCSGARNPSGIIRSHYDNLRGVGDVYVKDPDSSVKHGPTSSARHRDAGDHPALLDLHKRERERVGDIRNANISDQEQIVLGVISESVWADTHRNSHEASLIIGRKNPNRIFPAIRREN